MNIYSIFTDLKIQIYVDLYNYILTYDMLLKYVLCITGLNM